MAKTKSRIKRVTVVKEQEMDGVYFLKLVMYLIIGVQWLHITNASGHNAFSLPVGLLVGMVFALHDHFRIDRKIEFAVLLVATLVGYYAAIGISLNL